MWTEMYLPLSSEAHTDRAGHPYIKPVALVALWLLCGLLDDNTSHSSCALTFTFALLCLSSDTKAPADSRV